MKRALPSSFIVKDVPFRDILGVGVRVNVGTGDGVCVNPSAVSVCFARARAVLARDVSTTGGFVLGTCDFPHPNNVNRRKSPINVCWIRFTFMIASLIKIPPEPYRAEGIASIDRIACDRKLLFEAYLQPMSLQCGLLDLSRAVIDLMVRGIVPPHTTEGSAPPRCVPDSKLIPIIRSSA